MGGVKPFQDAQILGPAADQVHMPPLVREKVAGEAHPVKGIRANAPRRIHSAAFHPIPPQRIRIQLPYRAETFALVKVFFKIARDGKPDTGVVSDALFQDGSRKPGWLCQIGLFLLGRHGPLVFPIGCHWGFGFGQPGVLGPWVWSTGPQGFQGGPGSLGFLGGRGNQWGRRFLTAGFGARGGAKKRLGTQRARSKFFAEGLVRQKLLGPEFPNPSGIKKKIPPRGAFITRGNPGEGRRGTPVRWAKGLGLLPQGVLS